MEGSIGRGLDLDVVTRRVDWTLLDVVAGSESDVIGRGSALLEDWKGIGRDVAGR